MKRTVLYFFFIIIILSSCSIFQRSEDYIIDYVPRDSDVPGWSRTMAPLALEGDDISSYNKNYSGLGINSMVWCTFSSIENRGRIMTIEIIRFNSITDSYSFYSDVAGFSPAGTCSDNEYYNDTLAIIRAGDFIIYLKTNVPHLENTADLKNFSSVSKTYLGDNYSADPLPPLYNVLKRTGAQCVLYSRKGLAQAAGISRCYYTVIMEGEKSYFVFLSDRGSYYDCMNLFQKIILKKYIIIKADNTQSAFTRDEQGSYTFVSVYDRWIYGCWGVVDINDGKRILQNTRNAVESFSKSAH